MAIVTHRAMQEDLLRSLQYIIMEKLIFIIIIQILDLKYQVISRGINMRINLDTSLDIISLGIISQVEPDYLLLGREMDPDPIAV